MIEIILFVAVLVGFTTVIMKLGVQWGASQLSRDIEARLHAGETIVNDGQIPEEWLRSHRQRIEAMRQAGKSESDINRAGERAKAHVLRKLDDLRHFFKGTNLADGPDTKQFLLASLEEHQARWASANWQSLFISQSSPANDEERYRERSDLC